MTAKIAPLAIVRDKPPANPPGSPGPCLSPVPSVPSTSQLILSAVRAAHAEGRSPSATEIGRIVGRDPGHVSRLIRKMKAEETWDVGEVAEVAKVKPAEALPAEKAKVSAPTASQPVPPPADLSIESESPAIDVRTFSILAAPDPLPGHRTVDVTRVDRVDLVTDDPPADDRCPDPAGSAVGGPSGAGGGAGEGGGEVVAVPVVPVVPVVLAPPGPPEPADESPAIDPATKPTADARRLAKNEKKRLARAKAREAKSEAKASVVDHPAVVPPADPPATPPTSHVDAPPAPAVSSAIEPPVVAPVGGQDAATDIDDATADRMEAALREIGETKPGWLENVLDGGPPEPEPVYVIHPFEDESKPTVPAPPPKPKASKPVKPTKAATTVITVPSKPIAPGDLSKLSREDRIREFRRLAEDAKDLDFRVLRFSWNYYEGSKRFPTDLLIADKFNISTARVAEVAEGWAAKDVWICRRTKAGVPPGPVAQLGVKASKGSRDPKYTPTGEQIAAAKGEIQAGWTSERAEGRRLLGQPEEKVASGCVAMRRAGKGVDGGRSA